MPRKPPPMEQVHKKGGGGLMQTAVLVPSPAKRFSVSAALLENADARGRTRHKSNCSQTHDILQTAQDLFLKRLAATRRRLGG